MKCILFLLLTGGFFFLLPKEEKRLTMAWMKVDKSAYSPIAQAIVLLKRNDSENQTGAENFYKYLSSEKAKNIFRKYGCIVLEN
jgi:ABC-type molybdate transport system substrate-binding protein